MAAEMNRSTFARSILLGGTPAGVPLLAIESRDVTAPAPSPSSLWGAGAGEGGGGQGGGHGGLLSQLSTAFGTSKIQVIRLSSLVSGLGYRTFVSS